MPSSPPGPVDEREGDVDLRERQPCRRGRASSPSPPRRRSVFLKGAAGAAICARVSSGVSQAPVLVTPMGTTSKRSCRRPPSRAAPTPPTPRARRSAPEDDAQS